jgi:hypothetical protein
MMPFRVVLLSFLCILFLSGCADFKSKFIRKKEEDTGPRSYYAVRDYDIKPSIELYQKRYIYWKNWHRELMDDLDDSNSKKAEVDIEQAISNLTDMKAMLVDEKAQELQKLIDEMQQQEKILKDQSITGANRVKLRRRLEMLLREIKREFSYRKMEDFIRSEFN